MSFRGEVGCLKLTPTELVFVPGDDDANDESNNKQQQQLMIIRLTTIQHKQMSPANYSKHVFILKLQQASAEGAQKVFTLTSRQKLEALNEDVSARMEGKEPPSRAPPAAVAVQVGAFAATGGMPGMRKGKGRSQSPVPGAVASRGGDRTGKARRSTADSAVSTTSGASIPSQEPAGAVASTGGSKTGKARRSTADSAVSAVSSGSTTLTVEPTSDQPSMLEQENAKGRTNVGVPFAPEPTAGSSRSITPVRGLKGKRAPSTRHRSSRAGLRQQKPGKIPKAFPSKSDKMADTLLSDSVSSAVAPAPEPDTTTAVDSYLVEATLVEESSRAMDDGDIKDSQQETAQCTPKQKEKVVGDIFQDEEMGPLMVVAEPAARGDKFQRRVILAFFALFCFLLVILSVGLGVGLSFLNKGDDEKSSTEKEMSTILTSAPTAALTMNNEQMNTTKPPIVPDSLIEILEVGYTVIILPPAENSINQRHLQALSEAIKRDVKANLENITELLAVSMILPDDPLEIIPPTKIEMEPLQDCAGVSTVAEATCEEVTAFLQVAIDESIVTEEDIAPYLEDLRNRIEEGIEEGALEELVPNDAPFLVFRLVEKEDDKDEDDIDDVDESLPGNDEDLLDNNDEEPIGGDEGEDENSDDGNLFDEEQTVTNSPTEAPTIGEATTDTETDLSNSTTIAPSLEATVILDESMPLMRNGIQMKYVLNREDKNFCGHNGHNTNRCGGHLASITSEAEWDLLINLTDSCARTKDFWIGGVQHDKGINEPGQCPGSWSWSDGSGNLSSFICEKFKKGQPDNQQCIFDRDKYEDHIMVSNSNKVKTLQDKNGCAGNCSPKKWGVLILPPDYKNTTLYPDCETGTFIEIDSCLQQSSPSDRPDPTETPPPLPPPPPPTQSPPPPRPEDSTQPPVSAPESDSSSTVSGDACDPLDENDAEATIFDESSECPSPISNNATMLKVQEVIEDGKVCGLSVSELAEVIGHQEWIQQDIDLEAPIAFGTVLRARNERTGKEGGLLIWSDGVTARGAWNPLEYGESNDFHLDEISLLDFPGPLERNNIPEVECFRSSTTFRGLLKADNIRFGKMGLVESSWGNMTVEYDLELENELKGVWSDSKDLPYSIQYYDSAREGWVLSYTNCTGTVVGLTTPSTAKRWRLHWDDTHFFRANGLNTVRNGGGLHAELLV